MKIRCNCDHIIVDQTDYLKFKGYIISDVQWFDFWDAIDEAIEKPGSTKEEKEKSCMELRNLDLFKTSWECTNCGTLFINGNDNKLKVYSPESKSYNGVLNKIVATE